ncbi:AMP-binding protein [Nocardia alni]|uniref:AMP-binding protein n=1 Tax=Nocardia alni TaxID=2815723 RepID=UPI001C23B18F|nr:AMP-binding protein [Nocardia alni]
MSERRFAGRIIDETAAMAELWRAGMLPRSRGALRGLGAVSRLGQLGGLPAYCAAAHPDRPVIIDDRGTLTGREFARRAHRLANALRARFGDRPPTVGILCRNHADAVVTLCAASAIGARVVLLNSDFGPRQVAEVGARENLDALVYDADFATAAASFEGARWCAWDHETASGESLAAVIDSGSEELPPAPPRPSSVVILTSGSSGVPKGAPRNHARTMLLPAGLLSRIPLRPNENVLVSAPVFHGWGLLVAVLTLTQGSTLVLHRRFDAARALTDLQRHRCAVFIAVPTMLRRILALGDQLATADLSDLRIVASGGARLDDALVADVLAAFGPVLHNLYGSTEASYISIATPADLRLAPDCAGTPPRGNTIRITDDTGRDLPADVEGRILARTSGQIRAYTDGRTGSDADGYFDTGDRGRLDAAGRLYVMGRSDNMIVSGGENVYPEEVELALLAHPGITDAVVTPVADTEFGQRLRAYIVISTPESLGVEQIRTHIAAHLPRSRMPRDIIPVPELPRGASGKVLRRTLEELERTHS